MRPEEMVGLVLGHYRIIEPIGRGGMATVFLAQDIYLQRKVAVKIFEPKTGESDIFWRRFTREAQVVAQLDHPNILMVHEYGEHNSFAYFIMPYLELGSLRDRLRRRKILPLHDSIDIIAQILQALQYAHERGLMHRDIKPDNILFKTETMPVLSDFGLAKVFDGTRDGLFASALTQANATIVGTPQYMAPEQIQGKPTPASDIYSIGVVLYEMLTGVPPFVADNAIRLLTMHINERPRPLRELNPAIPPALEAVVLRALAKDQTARYPQPRDFLQALVQIPFPIENPPMPSMPLVSGNDRDRTELRRGASPFTAGAQRGPYATVTAQVTTSAPIVSPKRKIFSPTLIGLLIGVVVFASLGAWYSLPYLRAKGASSLASVTTAKLSSGTTTALKNTAPVSLASTSSTELATPQSACPAQGTARAAVFSPLTGGLEHHQNVVYVNNGFVNVSVHDSLLMRYDADNGKQVSILELLNAEINKAQVSSDGQWILFESHFEQTQGDTTAYRIQIVRIDGKELQTLYCANMSSLISYNASNRVILTEAARPGAVGTIYQLNLNDGSMQRELMGQLYYDALGWPAPDSVYLRDNTSQHNVYLLHLTIDNRPAATNNLQFITASSICNDFSNDGTSFDLYVSSCAVVGGGVVNRFCESTNCPIISGPSTISIWSRDDQTQRYQKGQALYTNNAMAVVQIRVISSQTLLALVANNDTSYVKNGVWKLTMKTGAWQLLVPDTFQDARVMLNAGSAQSLANSPQTWSNVSRDGQRYAVRVASPQSLGYDALYLGAMDGNGRQKFASSVNGSQLFIAGWIIM